MSFYTPMESEIFYTSENLLRMYRMYRLLILLCIPYLYTFYKMVILLMCL